LNVACREISCAILIEVTFPFSPPRVCVLERSKYYLKIPHIDRDGLLCLGDVEYDYFAGKRSIKYLHQRAYELFDRGFSNSLNDDFEEEFLSYWPIGNGRVYYCANLKNSFSKIVFCHFNNEIYFFENISVGESWLKKLFSDQLNDRNLRRKVIFNQTVIIPLENAWLPDQYPRTGSDILSLVEKHGHDAMTKLEECTPIKNDGFLPILFYVAAATSNTLIAITVRGSSAFSRNKRAIMKKTATLRFFSSKANLTNMLVQRVDANWLHYRGEAGHNRYLKEMRVAILGCGAIGAPVADMLCRAGIGTLTLFDPDNFLWDNLYRHILGPEHINRNKAEALASVLQKKFPEASISHVATKWEQHFLEQAEPQLKHFHLILSLIGDTENNTELYLSSCAVAEAMFPQVIFGWVEAVGAAGHAVLLGHEKYGCLSCRENGHGQLRDVFNFTEKKFVKLPACNIVFAPYGFIDLAPVVAVICGLALDSLSEIPVEDNYRIWVSNVKKMANHGGQLSAWFTNKFSHIKGEQVIRTRWSVDSECEVCGESRI